ncbi:MAG: sigma-70 family RNA polymerase sigma factor [Myxococcales bacterium]|nr:sigma-70 family RNA polymerase sigma factor [Myxococcales bacterium]
MNDRPLDTPRLDAEARSYAKAIALRFVKDDTSAADDIAQDAMLLAHRHLSSYRGDARFSTWLYRVTTTAALMHLRRQRRRGREVLATVDDGTTAWIEAQPSRAPSSEALAVAREQCARALRGVDRLGARYGEVFELRYALGCTESEIARATGLSLAAVKTRAHRAKIAARRACPADDAAVSAAPRPSTTGRDRS